MLTVDDKLGIRIGILRAFVYGPVVLMGTIRRNCSNRQWTC